MCSAHHLIVFNVCVKFHENMSSGFKVMEWTQKLLTDTHTQRKDENYIPPWHTLFCCLEMQTRSHRNLLHFSTRPTKVQDSLPDP